MDNKKVIAIVGSSRVGGNCEQIAKIVLDSLEKKGFNTEIISLAKKEINNCVACDRCRIENSCQLEDDFQSIFLKLTKADGIILVSPVYSFGPTPQILALKTRASRVAHTVGDTRKFSKSSGYTDTYPHPSLFRRKVGASIVIARRAGSSLTGSVLNTFFLSNEMFLVGSTYLSVAFGYEKGEALEDKEGLNNLMNLSDNISYILNKL